MLFEGDVLADEDTITGDVAEYFSSHPKIKLRAQLEKIKRDMIPLLENNSEQEKVIPLYAEQIEVSKRTVKVAELIIRKRKVTDTRKVGVDLITEQLTVRNPTGGASSSDNDE
jgi:stress response protein YsnF